MRKIDYKVCIIMFLVVACFAMEGCAEETAYKSIEDSVPTISVQGIGKVNAVPDEANIRFGVVSEEKMLAKAYKLNAESVNSIIKALKAKNIEAKDIKTSSYNISPVYPKDERGRRKPGKPVSFKVTQELTVKVRDMSKTGDVIDKVVSEGTNIFRGINFGSSKQEELEMEAKEKAAKDAKEKAELLAKSLGVDIGRVIRIGESTPQLYPTRRMASFDGAMLASASPQIEPGSMEVTANCSVVYEIIQ